MKSLLIVLPTYNESQNIELIITHLFAASKSMKKYSMEVLVVDDKSPDGTAKIVRSLIKKEKRISLLLGDKNGLGAAYIRGFEWAFKNRDPEIVVMMDSDHSHDPKVIPAMVREVERGADYVIGSRYIENGFIPGNWPLLRILNSRVASKIAYLLSDIDKDIKDITGGFKAIRASKLKEIEFASIETTGYGFMIHLLYRFMSNGATIKEVPITFHDRVFGESKLSYKDILGFLQCAYTINPESNFRKMVRFGTVGLIGSFINLASLFILKHSIHLPLLVLSFVAIEISIIANYIMHTYYTFRSFDTENDQGNWFTRLVKFNSATLFVAVFTLLLFSFMTGLLHINYLVAQFFAICISFLANFAVSKRIVWTRDVVA
jgi:dolichol-phosphate mannosyltransferase